MIFNNKNYSLYRTKYWIHNLGLFKEFFRDEHSLDCWIFNSMFWNSDILPRGVGR